MEVSVIVPVFNAGKYVQEAVDSALAQPEAAEVLLIEDGSEDDSLAACKRLSSLHERVRLLRHPDGVNRGVSASRNLGIREAKFDHVAFLDADDYYLPGRFSVARQVFEKYPGAEGVYGATIVLFESELAEHIWKSSPSNRLNDGLITVKERLQPEALFTALVVGGMGYFHANGIVVKRSLFDRAGFFDLSLSLHQDTAMWIKMAAVGCLYAGQIEEPVAVKRFYGTNRSASFCKGYDPYAREMCEILCQWAVLTGLSAPKVGLVEYRRWVESLFDYNYDRRAEFYPTSIWSIPLSVGFVILSFCRHPKHFFSRNLVSFLVTNVGKFMAAHSRPKTR